MLWHRASSTWLNLCLWPLSVTINQLHLSFRAALRAFVIEEGFGENPSKFCFGAKYFGLMVNLYTIDFQEAVGWGDEEMPLHQGNTSDVGLLTINFATPSHTQWPIL